MEITFVLNRFMDIGREEIKTVSVDSLDENLICCIEPLVPPKSYISFGEYYSNYNLMTYQRCYPYIRKNEKYEWVVPYEEVSIKDFMSTNDLDPTAPIKVDINNVGGAGDFDFGGIISWIILAWPYVKTGLDLSEDMIAISNFTRKVYKYFANKKKQVPIVNDAKEVISKRKTWTMEELKEHLKCEDEVLLLTTLKEAGYIYNGEEYVLEINIDEIAEDCYEDSEEYKSTIDCWGSYEYQGTTFDDLKFSIREFNIALTALYCQSDYYNSECFDIMIKRVDILIENYKSLLSRGDAFQFVIIDTNILLMDESLIDDIEREIQELNKCIEEMILYLQDKDER